MQHESRLFEHINSVFCAQPKTAVIQAHCDKDKPNQLNLYKLKTIVIERYSTCDHYKPVQVGEKEGRQHQVKRCGFVHSEASHDNHREEKKSSKVVFPLFTCEPCRDVRHAYIIVVDHRHLPIG